MLKQPKYQKSGTREQLFLIFREYRSLNRFIPCITLEMRARPQQLLLPDTDDKYAVHAAERFRTAVNNIKSLECPVSSSYGVSTYFPGSNHNPDYDALFEKLISEADQALYYSKKQGKNCIHHYNAVVAAGETYPVDAKVAKG